MTVETISGVRLGKRQRAWMANAVDTLEWFRACGLYDQVVARDQDPIQAVIDALNHKIDQINASESKR